MRKGGPNYEQHLAKHREWRAANRERIRAYNKRYRAEHTAEIADWTREYQRQNTAATAPHRSVYGKAWRAANQERKRETDRAYYLRNRAKRIAQAREWALAHPAPPELQRERRKRFLAARPGLNGHYLAARRARELAAPGSHTLAEWRAKVLEYEGRCAYCGESRPLTRDHILPLSRGGSDFISNVVPACKPCNSRKGSGLVPCWVERAGRSGARSG